MLVIGGPTTLSLIHSLQNPKFQVEQKEGSNPLIPKEKEEKLKK